MTREELRKKLDHIWFYEKWKIIGALFCAVVLVVTLRSCLARVNPDMTVLYICSRNISAEYEEALADAFTPFMEDINGDGRKKAAIVPIVIDVEALKSGISSYNTVPARFGAEVAFGRSALYLVEDCLVDYVASLGLIDQAGRFFPECGLFTSKGLLPVTATGFTAAAPKPEEAEMLAEGLADFSFLIRKYEGTQMAEDRSTLPYYEHSLRVLGRIIESAE